MGGIGGRRVLPVNMATRFEPRLLETQYFQNAQQVAKQLLGDGVAMSWDHAIYKPPHNGKATPWHQTRAARGLMVGAAKSTVALPFDAAVSGRTDYADMWTEKFVMELKLSSQEKKDLVAFLRCL